MHVDGNSSGFSQLVVYAAGVFVLFSWCIVEHQLQVWTLADEASEHLGHTLFTPCLVFQFRRDANEHHRAIQVDALLRHVVSETLAFVVADGECEAPLQLWQLQGCQQTEVMVDHTLVGAANGLPKVVNKVRVRLGQSNAMACGGREE